MSSCDCVEYCTVPSPICECSSWTERAEEEDERESERVEFTKKKEAVSTTVSLRKSNFLFHWPLRKKH